MQELQSLIQGLDHLVLRVVDLNRSIAFYRDVLGCTLERRVDDLGLVQLRAGDSLIDLVDVEGELGCQGGAPPAAEGHNLDHFCLRLAAFDEPALRDYLARKGLAPAAAARRYGAQGYGPSIYISDPDGNTIELKGPSD